LHLDLEIHGRSGETAETFLSVKKFYLRFGRAASVRGDSVRGDARFTRVGAF